MTLDKYGDTRGKGVVTDWAFDDNLFEVESPEEIDMEAFIAAMERRTFACTRGLVSPEEMEQVYQNIVTHFDPAKDHPASGQAADAVRSNFQKINLGGESRTANHDDARFFRAFYNPLWEEDVWGLRNSFVQLARTRNRLAGLPLDFAVHGIEANGLWTAARFHQYPLGGGFFRRHTDYVAKDVTDEKSTRFYQTVLTMTRKGEHYQTGGAFVDIGDDRICLDDNALMGDVIVYDGRTVHGVEDIDPQAMLDMNSINGRLAGFVTLFKKM
ncbi:MAG: hypothetical protein E6Q43_04210 [Dokdonella sp.]|nr:MAG: hypothetical protein E6Q43_04210 [Dokdonella sp.]